LESDVKMIACQMTMDLFEYTKDDMSRVRCSAAPPPTSRRRPKATSTFERAQRRVAPRTDQSLNLGWRAPLDEQLRQGAAAAADVDPSKPGVGASQLRNISPASRLHFPTQARIRRLRRSGFAVRPLCCLTNYCRESSTVVAANEAAFRDPSRRIFNQSLVAKPQVLRPAPPTKSRVMPVPLL
jgi:DsrE/DsrF/DrsH-like family